MQAVLQDGTGTLGRLELVIEPVPVALRLEDVVVDNVHDVRARGPLERWIGGQATPPSQCPATAPAELVDVGEIALGEHVLLAE